MPNRVYLWCRVSLSFHGVPGESGAPGEGAARGLKVGMFPVQIYNQSESAPESNIWPCIIYLFYYRVKPGFLATGSFIKFACSQHLSMINK